jgi:hypothetical protein
MALSADGNGNAAARTGNARRRRWRRLWRRLELTRTRRRLDSLEGGGYSNAAATYLIGIKQAT